MQNKHCYLRKKKKKRLVQGSEEGLRHKSAGITDPVPAIIQAVETLYDARTPKLCRAGPKDELLVSLYKQLLALLPVETILGMQ